MSDHDPQTALEILERKEPTLAEQIAALLQRAAQRLADIDRERDELLAAFPQLKKSGRPGGSTHSTKANGANGARVHYIAEPVDEPDDSDKLPAHVVAELRAHKHNQRYSNAVIDAFVARVRGGMTVPDAGRLFGFPTKFASAARKWCVDAGVTIPWATPDAIGETIAYLRAHKGRGSIAGLAEYAGINAGNANQRYLVMTKRGYARRLGHGEYELTAKADSYVSRRVATVRVAEPEPKKRRKGGASVSNAERIKVRARGLEMLRAGKSIAEICRELHVTDSAVYRWQVLARKTSKP